MYEHEIIEIFNVRYFDLAVKVHPHLHANTNEAGQGEAYTNICLDCNTRQNVIVRQASE